MYRRVVRQAGDSAPPVATPLPLSADIEETKPEIGGSFGGFIVLVVALAAIFLLSCIGIFILLRNHEPTPYERQIRRARARAHDFSSEAPIGPPGIRERLGRLFGRRSGWIRASAGEDGDEWDASDDRIPNAFASLRERDRAHDEYPATFATEAGRSRPRDNVAPSLSTDSVEVELSAPSAYHDGPRRSPGPRCLPDPENESAPSIGSAPVSFPVSESPPSVLPAPEAELEFTPRDERHFSVQSGGSGSERASIRSMRKFDNGTKFKESL
ncbi:hypothetical protein BV20DRAFT_795742 [Pilatotrama ljubarskyi]|nr:hypothetical protein BV20DRAFT_795742 [Pilatotrama ljubarskyi]